MDDIVSYNLSTFKKFCNKSPTIKRQELYKQVVEYSLDGELLHCFDSTGKASYYHKMAASTIYNSCNEITLYCKKTNTVFLYRGDDISQRILKIEQQSSDFEIWEFNLKGKLLCKYSSLTSAAKVNCVSSNTIKRCCEGLKLYLKDKIFLYSDKDIKERVGKVREELKRLSNKTLRCREVDEYSLEGTFIRAYPSVSAAARAYNVQPSTIYRCCNGIDSKGFKKYTCKQRIFLWVGDSISNRLNQIKAK